MAKKTSDRFDDDYFAEPNYDNYTDEELDELYQYGKLRSPSRKSKLAGKTTEKAKKKPPLPNYDDDWGDTDFDDDDDDFDDD